MFRPRTIVRFRKYTSLWLTRVFFNTLVFLCVSAAVQAQVTQREQPTWWFGGAGALNLNFYGGTTQMLNQALTTPAPFHKGFGAGFYLAPLVEYRPDPVWGAILQIGYDSRRASFTDVPCPCGEMSTLSAEIAYLTIEPSLRFAPFSDGLYIFGGPRIGFSWAPYKGEEKEFSYTQVGQPDTKSQFSYMKGSVYSLQVGVGYEFPLAARNAEYQVNISPFVSYQPYFGQDPRSVESWAVSTVRVGAAIKFGTGAVIAQPAPVPAVVERDVVFSVRAPKAVPLKRRVRETFPLRNYVFFDEGSAEIPDRYVSLTKDQATSFKEEQLQEYQPRTFAGRAGRQMVVYYNLLNILGDRMKRSPSTSVSLTGASGIGPELGKSRAEAVKKYLVDVFGIEGSRITTEGVDKPQFPAVVPGATKELAFLEAGDRRVDIESLSPELRIQVGGPAHYTLKPVPVVTVDEDPMDSQILFHVDGANETLASWSLEIADEQGKIKRFGPSTRDDENLSGNAILGDRMRGDYKVVLLAQTKGGKFVRKESPLHLVRRVEPLNDVVRYRILFEFGEAETAARYEKFLTEVVAPLIPDSGVVVIHGHTDIVGEEVYNTFLSTERVKSARAILEAAIAKIGQRGVTYETFGFGEDLQYAAFDNSLPEGRFYNRCVVIDIIPD